MKTNPTKNLQNNLRQARLRAGLERKQVAFLLSKKTVDELVRYEKGANKPNLETALKLEIMYQRPIRLLFEELFEKCRNEISKLMSNRPSLFPERNWFPKHFEQLSQEEYCFYSQMLTNQAPTAGQIELINKHIIALSHVVSDYKQGRRPIID